MATDDLASSATGGSRLAVVLLAIVWGGAAAWAQTPARLVRDLNPGLPGGGSSDPAAFTVVGERTFFLATTSDAGRELWATDGSEAGTYLVRDLEPGPDQPAVAALATVGGALYFTEDRFPESANQDGRTVFWRSDGTARGTVPVTDLAGTRLRSPDKRLVANAGRLYFAVNVGSAAETTIWTSDGTAAGTRPLRAYRAAFNSPSPELTGLGDAVLFAAKADGSGYELWRTDGTAAGTQRLRGDFPSSPRHLTAAGAQLYFQVTDRFGDSRALWKSDGTAAGTVLVRDRFSDEGGEVAAAGGLLFFRGADREDGRNGLWRSDGTLAGTIFLSDGAEGASGAEAFGGRLVFFDIAGDPERVQLRISDGTVPGTTTVLESETSVFAQLASLADRVLFSFPLDASIGLWASDGTAAGTHPISTVFPADPEGRFGPGQSPFYFSGSDGAHGAEPWTSDGTSAGTRLVRDLAPAPLASRAAHPRELTRLGAAFYFFASADPSDETAAELFRSDGTAAGTAQLTHFGDESRPWPARLVAAGARLFFARGSALWVSDGSAEGTRMLVGAAATPHGSLTDLTAVGSHLYYVRHADGDRLCRSDGTTAGSVCPDGPAIVHDLAPVGDRLFFVGGDPAALWVVVPGEEARPVRSVFADAAGASPYGLTALDNMVVFFADDGVHGVEPWRSDGTADGTVLVADINPGPADSAADGAAMVAFDGRLYLTADDGVHGAEPWRTAGTASSTELVADLVPGPRGAAPALARGGAHLFAFGRDEAGPALWAYDARARSVQRLPAGRLPSGTDGHDLVETAGGLAFPYCDDGGCEPWHSDGTPGGTRRLADVAAGEASSWPHALLPLGGELFLAADDGASGDEMWAIPLPAVPTCPGDCSGDGRVSIDELVAGVGIALGQQAIDRCLALDANGDGRAAIDELVGAVLRALSGCPGAGSPEGASRRSLQ